MKVESVKGGGVAIHLSFVEAADVRNALIEASSAHADIAFEVKVTASNLYMEMAAKAITPTRTFATKADIAAGRDFPCLVSSTCQARTRTLARSQTHATDRTELQSFGHLAK